MSRASRRLAGLLLILLPTVIYGGVTILRLLIRRYFSDSHVYLHRVSLA